MSELMQVPLEGSQPQWMHPDPLGCSSATGLQKLQGNELRPRRNARPMI
jgi:hypothetical protein